MALYAFDGTWNSDKPGAERDTNVLWFLQAYTDRTFYRPGVGTRLGPFGQVLGGITGAGGFTRVEEGLEQLMQNMAAGDEIIDVVGFSRGAALAVHFTNKVAALPNSPPIRFLGIWDCVPSFGAPSIDLNLGWELGLADNVQKCYHAMSLDERRSTFHPHRLDARVEHADQEGRLFEVWFRGVHSDVGGGNKNPALSSIALNWMFRKAVTCGLPIDTAKVEANVPRMNPVAPDSEAQWYDVIKNKYRVVRWNDQAHVSVSFREDTKRYNNPPVGLALVGDDGIEVRKFSREAAPAPAVV
jgi:uncharacterized protein (DUF2235 family)